MGMITMEQYGLVRDAIKSYRCYVWDFINRIPNKSASLAASAALYDTEERTTDAMQDVIARGAKFDDVDLRFMLEVVEYAIKDIGEPKSKDRMDLLGKYKALREDILSWRDALLATFY